MLLSINIDCANMFAFNYSQSLFETLILIIVVLCRRPKTDDTISGHDYGRHGFITPYLCLVCLDDNIIGPLH